MIRGRFEIDVSRDLRPSWDNERHAHRQIDCYLRDPDAARIGVEILVGNRMPPAAADDGAARIPDYWKQLATIAPDVDVKGGIHVGEWCRFLSRARGARS